MNHTPPTLAGSRVLIVDDLAANLNLLRETLEPMGCEIFATNSAIRAMDLIPRSKPDLILLDVRMPEMDGFTACSKLKSDPATADIPIVFITADRETDSLVKGFRLGAVDYIAKPFQPDEVRLRVETHLRLRLALRALQRKNEELATEIARRQTAEASLATAAEELSLISDREAEHWGLPGFVGRSPTLQRILQDIRRLQSFPSSVLVTGESGTGKELIARAIHYGGLNAQGRFVTVNCSAVPNDLAESLFFGHLKGSFTGATSDRKGYFELAHHGTLFLDEIGDMSLPLQAKLLRVLEDGVVQPVGSTHEKKVSVRVIAASNVNFQERIANGRFRQDLYFRLAKYVIATPPLRERRDDIPLLAEHLLRRLALETARPFSRLSPEAQHILAQYDYPGNVRELKNILERAFIESEGKDIQPEHLHFFTSESVSSEMRALPQTPGTQQQGTQTTADKLDLPLNLEEAEELIMRKALDQTNGNLAAAARLLGIHRLKLYRRIKQK